MSKETDEFERDLKGYPSYRDEKLHTAQMDYNYECQLEQAKNLIDFNDIVQINKKQLDNLIENYNCLIDSYLNDFPQIIIKEFYYKKE